MNLKNIRLVNNKLTPAPGALWGTFINLNGAQESDDIS